MYSGEESTVLPGEFEDAWRSRLRRWLLRRWIMRLLGLAALTMFVLSAGMPTGYGG